MNEDNWRQNTERLAAAVRSAAGFTAPPEILVRFNQIYFCNHRNENPRLAHLAPDPAGRMNWFQKLEVSIAEVRTGLTAVHYHAKNIGDLELAACKSAMQVLPHLGIAPGTTIATGGYERIDFEYHSYVMAARRTLEYLSGSIANYFKRECHSLRKLSRVMQTARNFPEVSSRISRRTDLALEKIATTIGAGNSDRSVRDRLAHWENVPSGTLNMSRIDNRYRVQIFGGGENLTSMSGANVLEIPLNPEKTHFAVLGLSPKIKTQIGVIEWLIFGSYWDIGLLEFPKLGGRSVNGNYEHIPDTLNVAL